MKALVLAGGAGTRLRPLTHTFAKQLVPVANEPILFYGLRDLAAAGIVEVGMIVGETRDEIEAAVGDGSAFGLEVTYIPQDAPLGLAHCVLIAREFLGDDLFIMYLGDNMLESGISSVVDAFSAEHGAPSLDGHGTSARILLAEVDDPRQFGVAALDDHGAIAGLVEKPADPPSNLALVGVYAFDARIHEAVRSIEPSARGELEITDAIQWLLDHGHHVDHEILEGWWIDTGKKDSLLQCNQLVLDRIAGRIDGDVDATSRAEGRVVLEAGAQLVGSTVRGPAVIGARTIVRSSYIGPYTSIGADCTIDGSEIEHSVILDGTRVLGVHRLRDSLLGREVEVTSTGQRPPGTRLLLGDHSVASLE